MAWFNVAQCITLSQESTMGRKGYGYNRFGTKEEYLARKLKFEKRQARRFHIEPDQTPQERRQEREAIGAPGLGMLALEAKRDRLNKIDPTARDDPWTIDHIRPLSQGGLTVRDNCRIIRKSQNTRETRTEEKIAQLLLINKMYLHSGE